MMDLITFFENAKKMIQGEMEKILKEHRILSIQFARYVIANDNLAYSFVAKVERVIEAVKKDLPDCPDCEEAIKDREMREEQIEQIAYNLGDRSEWSSCNDLGVNAIELSAQDPTKIPEIIDAITNSEEGIRKILREVRKKDFMFLPSSKNMGRVTERAQEKYVIDLAVKISKRLAGKE